MSRPVRKFYSLEEAVSLVTAEANKDIILDANHDSNSVAKLKPLLNKWKMSSAMRILEIS